MSRKLKNIISGLLAAGVIICVMLIFVILTTTYGKREAEASAPAPESTLHVYECRTLTLDKSWAVSCLVYESTTKKHFVLIDTLHGAAMAPLD